VGMMSRPFAATKTNNNNKTVPGGNVTFYLYTLCSGIYSRFRHDRARDCRRAQNAKKKYTLHTRAYKSRKCLLVSNTPHILVRGVEEEKQPAAVGGEGGA